MVKPLLTSVVKRVAYVIAALVILAAISVAISRTLTPYINARRPQIEKWASDLLHEPITIGKASVTWHMYEPGVALHDVTLLDQDKKSPLLQLREVKIFFSIPQSLWQRKLVYSGVMISGAELIVHRNEGDALSVQGFPQFSSNNDQPYALQTKAKEVLGFLFAQPRLILRNIDVRYTGFKGLKRYVTLYNLKMENNGDEHSIAGKAILHQAIPTELSLAATFNGNEPDPEKIQGKMYLNLSGFSLDQWLQGLEWYNWKLTKGLLAAKIWVSWDEGKLNRIQTSFQLYDVNLYSAADKSNHTVNRLSGDVGWKKEQKDQIVAGDDILIDWSERLWPVTSFYLKLSPDLKGALHPVTMNIGYLDVSDTYSILTSFAKVIPDDIDHYMAAIGMQGNLENIRITFPSDAADIIPQSIDGDFNRLSIKAWNHLPGLKHLSGKFSWQKGKGSVEFKSSSSVIDYDDIFNQPILLEALVGKLDWKRQGKTYNFSLHDFAILNKDLAMNVSGNITIPETYKPEVDLNANFTVNHAQHITRYLPQKVFDSKLNSWLNSAFLSGDVQSGSMVLRGPLYDFPFEKGNGQFVISGAVNNVQLHYAPDWPDLKNISGTVKFSGTQVIVDVDHAQLMDVSVPQMHAEIPKLGADNAVVNISGKPIQTDFHHALNFVRNSPLKDSVGRMFKNAELSGPIALSISLGILLDNPDKSNVNGVISIHDGRVLLKTWDLDIKHLQGKVDFTQYGTRASGIQGEIFGKPLQLTIDTINERKPDASTRLIIDNYFDLADLEKWLHIPLDKVAKGSARAQTRIDIVEGKPITINLSSNLLGISLDLPEQYAKPEDEQRQFNAEIIVDEGKPLKINLGYAGLLSAAMIILPQADTLKLKAVNLHLGDGIADWPDGDGLFITGKLKQLSWAQIEQYAGENTSGVDLPLNAINLKIDQLIVMGIDLGKTGINIKNQHNNWLLDIDTPKVSGNAEIPKQLSAEGKITANLKYISLDSLADIENGMGSINARTLPSIDISAEEVEYYGVPFNIVKLVTSPNKTGLDIKQVSIDGRGFKLHAQGSWNQDGNGSATVLRGNASTANVTEFLEDMDFDAHNFLASKGSIEFDLTWKSTPYELSLKTLSGTASLDIGKGRIIEISGTSDAQMDIGRMLNIFSLQTIPRRLSLDFSDMFEKGYSFDYLRGDYKFENGDVHTANMQFDGPVAKVSISGKIGLVDEDFDLKLHVKPYVTSSLPVAATLITGQPVIGIAALIVNKILSGEVSKAVTYSYAVKGSWNDPEWTKIKEKKTKN